MKIAVAGSGSIGRRHINNLRLLEPETEILLLRRDAREDDYSAEQGFQVRDYDALGSEAVDALIIATPSAFHCALILQALEKGIPAYIEKPLVTRREDCEQIAEVLNTSNNWPVTLMGCNLRFLPSLQKMRELLQEGIVGRVHRASFEAGQWLPDWRPTQDYKQSYSASKKLGGGVTLDLIHETDAARWLLGEMESTESMASKSESLGIETESVLSAVMRTKEDVLVSLSLDYISRVPVRQYKVIGDKGTLIWDLSQKTLQLITPGSTQSFCRPEDFDVSQTYIAAMTSFLESICSKTSAEQDIIEGLKSCELALNLKASAGYD